MDELAEALDADFTGTDFAATGFLVTGTFFLCISFLTGFDGAGLLAAAGFFEAGFAAFATFFGSAFFTDFTGFFLIAI
ncbi:MAG TPA: hypothetical protein VGM24_11905 [Puia sp.]